MTVPGRPVTVTTDCTPGVIVAGLTEMPSRGAVVELGLGEPEAGVEALADALGARARRPAGRGARRRAGRRSAATTASTAVIGRCHSSVVGDRDDARVGTGHGRVGRRRLSERDPEALRGLDPVAPEEGEGRDRLRGAGHEADGAGRRGEVAAGRGPRRPGRGRRERHGDVVVGVARAGHRQRQPSIPPPRSPPAGGRCAGEAMAMSSTNRAPPTGPEVRGDGGRARGEVDAEQLATLAVRSRSAKARVRPGLDVEADATSVDLCRRRSRWGSPRPCRSGGPGSAGPRRRQVPRRRPACAGRQHPRCRGRRAW